VKREESNRNQTALHRVTQSERLHERAKKRCVGSLDGHAVYFVGSSLGFHLAIECASGAFRRLSETEHLRFKLQSRIDGLSYGRD